MSDVQPMLVAYRNGFVDDKGILVPWTSTPASTAVTLSVDSVYSVAVVCMVGNGVVIWQASHTVDDDRPDDKTDPMLQTPCTTPGAAPSAVTGTLVKAGTVHVDDVSTDELSANSTFTLQVADGTHDVITSDPGDMKALIQRDVAISGAKDLGPIDASTGVALTPVAKLTLDNPPKPKTDDMDTVHTETVEAKVLVATKNNASPGEVFFAAYDLTKKQVSAFAYPSAMLAADDVQSAAFIGHNTKTGPDIADTTTTDPDKKRQTTVTTTRSQTRPLTDATASGMTTFQLPALINAPGWAVDMKTNTLSVALPALPALDDLTVLTSGTSTGGTPVTYQVNITASFFQQAGLARPVFDTALPGFPSGSQIDFTKAYSRDIVSQRDVVSKGTLLGHETSQFHEEVSALAQ